MNLRALLHNAAKPFFRGLADRIKYLYWLYGRSLTSGASDHLTLRLKFDPPVREIDLTVRRNGGSDAFIFSEVFEHRYYDFDLSPPPATVLDLGANIGFTSLFFARKYPQARIACVEPMPGNVSLLRTNLERNGVPARVFAKAIAVDDQPLIMQVADKDYGHKVSHINYGRAMEGETLRVDGISMPTLLAELGWPRIDLLKVDIEGYEGVLLSEQCEWLKHVEAICIECHEGYGEDDLRALASRFGFDPPRQLPGTWLLNRKNS